MTLDPTVSRDARPYRQGMVLGLTMAEIMLLLVFCLLLAAAALLARERSLLAESRRDLREAQSELAQIEEREAALRRQLGADRPEEDWRRLVDAAAWAAKMEDAGVSLPVAAKAAPFIAELLPLYAEGITSAQLQDAAELMPALKEAAKAQGRENLTSEEAVTLIGAGLAAEYNESSRGAHNWPPIISLREAEGYYFETGSAELSPQFRSLLGESVVPELLEILRIYGVDLVEVIGHTDEQPIATRPSNLDRGLPSVLGGDAPVATLVPADNAGLGLARAVSVAQVLRRNESLAGYTILPLSGGQLIDLGDRLTTWKSGGDVKERRRIEIRVRRSDPGNDQETIR